MKETELQRLRRVRAETNRFLRALREEIEARETLEFQRAEVKRGKREFVDLPGMIGKGAASRRASLDLTKTLAKFRRGE